MKGGGRMVVRSGELSSYYRPVVKRTICSPFIAITSQIAKALIIKSKYRIYCLYPRGVVKLVNNAKE